jgi:hypothetical protein
MTKSGPSHKVCCACSVIFLPNWLHGFIRHVVHYTDYTATGSPIWIVTGYYLPQLGGGVEIGLTVLLLAYLLYQWRVLPRLVADSERFIYRIILTIFITNLVATRTATTNQITLLVPILASLRQIEQRLRFGAVYVVIFYVISFSGIWFAFFRTVEGIDESPLVYFVLPALALLYFIGQRSEPAAGLASSEVTARASQAQS